MAALMSLRFTMLRCRPDDACSKLKPSLIFGVCKPVTVMCSSCAGSSHRCANARSCCGCQCLDHRESWQGRIQFLNNIVGDHRFSRYRLHAFVVRPNHVHADCSPSQRGQPGFIAYCECLSETYSWSRLSE